MRFDKFGPKLCKIDNVFESIVCDVDTYTMQYEGRVLKAYDGKPTFFEKRYGQNTCVEVYFHKQHNVCQGTCNNKLYKI